MGRKLNIILVSALMLGLGGGDPGVQAQTSSRRKAKTSVSSKNSTAARNNSAKGKGATKNGSKGKSGTKGGARRETSSDVKRQQEATQKEIRQTKEQLQANEAKVRSGLSELSRLQGDIDVSRKKVSTLSSKVSQLNGEISGLEKKIESDRKEVERMRAEYLKAIKKMRTGRKNLSPLAFIFSAESFNQGLRRMRYLREFSSWKEKRSKEINAKVAELKAESERLQTARKEQSEALGRQQSAQRQLETQKSRQDMVVADLRAEGAALNAHLSKKQAEANQLKNRIATLIAEEERRAAEERRRQEEARQAAERKAAEEAAARQAAAERAAEEAAAEAAKEKKGLQEAKTEKETKPKKEQPKKEAKPKKETKPKKEAKPKKEQPKKETPKNEAPKSQPKKETPKVSGGGGNFAAQRGSLPKPVDGHFRITAQFGRHSLPDLPDVVYDNPGIDVEVSSGATAKAVYGGRVTGVYMLPGFGTVVILSHGNYYTVYGNLASANVKVGDQVSQGAALGRVANDPDDSSHGQLHFEVWKNRDKLDPSGWLR